LFISLQLVQAATNETVLFTTGFEEPEYETGFTLEGQPVSEAAARRWMSDAIGGNQVFAGFFPDMGQHGLVGFSDPDGDVTAVSVWRPITFDPVAAGLPVITFTVTMAIADSEERTERDSFRWSVYNTNATPHRLFSLDFDNKDRSISYLLDDNLGFVVTPFQFERDGLYNLLISMHFADNRWTATLNDELVVDAQPITTTNAALHLGDISAVWVQGADNPRFGDNFMVFDDYTITAASTTPAQLELVERRENGDVLLRLGGENGRSYAIDASSNLVDWSPLHTNIVTAGTFEHLDVTAGQATIRFFRGRLVQ
jgi:hypothetical protein